MLKEETIYQSIATVIDPEVGFNLVEMGLIYNVEIKESNDVVVTMTLSTQACPLHQLIVQWVKEACEKVEGVKECEINLVWEPAWNITMADDNVKKALGA
ncbi:iron-sulfur cluster assembly protein [Sulfurimonas sp. HSL-1716]|uniref:metal-sulfur cluster assembly factor n=1 Tax=Hydrocurvibacter sulfurireducens TaxID=3131937 RepID=UPI0031F8E20A